MNRQKKRLVFTVLMTILFPVIFYYLSPYLIIQGASQGIIAGDVLTFIGLFVSSLFFGRAWCGWLCPGGATQELCMRVNNKAFNGKKRNLIKYLIWAPWIAIVVVLFIHAGGIKAVNPLYQTWKGVSVQDLPSAVMFLAIAGAIATFALVAGKRAVCHSFCWIAPFIVIGTKIKSAVGYPSLHLEADKSKCLNGRQCSGKCPMSIDVAEMVQKENMTNTECISCGSCVDICPKGAIKFSYTRPKKWEKP